ncbi:MAG TPA: galactosyltransferase-related protein [Rhodocyclaceae bacterium]
MPALSLVTTCMGRLAHLQQSLPRMAAQADVECILVDYACPQQSGQWAAGNLPGVRVLRLEQAAHFSAAHARNLGAAQATAPWLAFVDADVLLADDFAADVAPLLQAGRYYRPAPLAPDLWGCCLVARDVFAHVGGYDEALQSWGGEDDDLYHRLRWLAGQQPGEFPAGLLDFISHSDAERIAHGDGAERWLSQRANALYLHIKYDLMAVMQRAELDLGQRQALYREVRRTVLGSGASNARVEIRLPPELKVPLSGWGIRRTWLFDLERIPGTPENPFAGA